jgi:hypothetical protein
MFYFNKKRYHSTKFQSKINLCMTYTRDIGGFRAVSGSTESDDQAACVARLQSARLPWRASFVQAFSNASKGA